MLYYFKTFICLFFTLFCFSTLALANSVEVLKDIRYGEDKAQTFDVYIPTKVKDAPVIFMIHGGAWSGGDKADKGNVENKVAHWTNKGFIFVSTNYRTLPAVAPIGQAKDIERSLRFAQQQASSWGGSADKFILMGHSSGAHLASLVSANYLSLVGNGVKPWLGTVSIDISGYDIVKKVFGETPSKFYQDKFGKELDYLKKASPLHRLTDKIPPFLAICSTQNGDACEQATHFLNKAKSLGSYSELIVSDFSHNNLNSELGKAVCYTKNVDIFLMQLTQDLDSQLNSNDSGVGRYCSSD